MKEKVLAYLKQFNVGKTPTEIGIALGKNYNSASSSVSIPLKQLVDDDIVIREKIDGKILYKLNRKKATKS
jgi:DNA-binding transcriptional ArsR family regulator